MSKVYKLLHFHSFYSVERGSNMCLECFSMNLVLCCNATITKMNMVHFNAVCCIFYYMLSDSSEWICVKVE